MKIGPSIAQLTRRIKALEDLLGLNKEPQRVSDKRMSKQAHRYEIRKKILKIK